MYTDIDNLFGGSKHVSQSNIDIREYLREWRSDKLVRLSAAGRIYHALSEGKKTIDTASDMRLGRIFSNRAITIYPRLSMFRGIEDQLHEVAEFFRFASLYLEQMRQIVYLVGPVSSGKSTLVDLLKKMACEVPMWVLADKEGNPSPFFESPLGLFNEEQHGRALEELQIPGKALPAVMSSWAARKLQEYKGQWQQFRVVQIKPSLVTRAGIARVELSEDDDAALIGRAAENGELQAYDASGGLNRTTQGLVELFEVFKVLNPKRHLPLIAATTDRKYNGAGNIGELAHQGVILAHSNEPEWKSFREKDINKALVSRITKIDFPYNTRLAEEVQTYEDYLATTELSSLMPTARALEPIAIFALQTRYCAEHRDKKLRAYNGETWLKGEQASDPNSTDDLREKSKLRDGMTGVPPRDIFSEVIPKAASRDHKEAGIDVVSVYEVLELLVTKEFWPEFHADRKNVTILEQDVRPVVREIVTDAIQQAFVDNYEVYADKEVALYAEYADHWSDEKDYKDPETGDLLNLEQINVRLLRYEKDAAIRDPREFRKKVARAAWRHRGTPLRLSLDPDFIRKLEKNILPTYEDMLHIIEYKTRDDDKEQKKHNDFVERLLKRGYTERQARRLVDWYIKNCK